jgi:hypothetical protein
MYNETKIENENNNVNQYNKPSDNTDRNINNIKFHINEDESYTIDIFDKNESDDKSSLKLNIDNFKKGNNNVYNLQDLNKEQKSQSINELSEDKNIKDIIKNIKREISLIDYKRYSPKIYNENINKEDSYTTDEQLQNSEPQFRVFEDRENAIIDDENNYKDLEEREIQIIENIELWTDNIEEQIENFAELCEKESIELNKKGDNNLYIGRSMQILLIILGSISVYSSSTTMLDSSIRDIIVLLSGFSTTVISSIYTMFGFTKKSTLIYEISLGLDNISRMIRCELLKPRNIRKSPYDLIYICNITRDKLIKKREYN